MKINEIYVELGRTATNNFNSLRNTVGLRTSIENDDDPDRAVRQLQEKAHRLLLWRGRQVQGDED